MNVDGQDRNTDYLLSILIFSLMLNWFVYSTDLCSIDWYLLMSRIYFTYTNNSTVKLTPYDTENRLLNVTLKQSLPQELRSLYD